MANYQDVVKKFLNLNQQDFDSSFDYVLSDKSTIKDFYISIFIELHNFLVSDDLPKIKTLSSLIEKVFIVDQMPIIQECYGHDRNPLRSTNLVILSCKYKKYLMLDYLFSAESTLLSNMSKVKMMSPVDEDGESHNAFYYAMLSDSIQLLSLLLDEWAKNYFVCNPEELVLILSSVYAQHKLNNVLLHKEIEIFVEKKLLESKIISMPTELNIDENTDSRKQREELILYLIHLVDSDEDDGVSERFLFLLKCIAQNIYILKRQMKHTYSSLPWEEIEFCVITFVSFCSEESLGLFYQTILNKVKIQKHLSNFSIKLKTIKIVGKGMPLSSNRDEVVSKICEDSPEFKDLYEDFRQIRDIYSLVKIDYFVKLALSIDSADADGWQITIRCLHGIGEHLKNTLELPKMSTTLSNLIISSLPENLRHVIVELHHSLSHEDSLSQRMEIQRNRSSGYFVFLRSDIKMMADVVSDTLNEWKILSIKNILKIIIKCSDVSEIQELSNLLLDGLDKSVDDFISPNDRLKNKIVNLRLYIDALGDPPEYFSLLFDSIYSTLSAEENKCLLNVASNDRLCKLKRLLTDIGGFPTDDGIARLKFEADKVLSAMKCEISHNDFGRIWLFLLTIYDQISFSSTDSQNRDRIYFLISEILVEMEFITNNITCINEWGEDLISRRPSTRKNILTPKNIGENTSYFEEKLLELRNFFAKHDIKLELGSLMSFNNMSNEFQASLEFIILDILAVLSVLNDGLKENFFFFADVFPMLIGRSLMDHVSYDNSLVNTLLCEKSNILLLNAFLLLENNFLDSNKKVGKLTVDEPLRVRDMYDKRLCLIDVKENLFAALSEGNLDCVKSLVQRGANLNARSIDLMTTFHFAVKGGSLETIKFLLNEGIPIYVTDGKGRSPLHIAALHGQEEAIKYLLKEGGCNIDELDKRGNTPLHLAAAGGHRAVVELLLRCNANSDIPDCSGILPVHCAIDNNHIDVVKTFHETNGFVDIAETFWGHTALQMAVAVDHTLLVNFLIAIGSNVNSRTDELFTPLHGASLNGNLKVAEALVSKGAIVNARVLGGFTPLHYATHKRGEHIVDLLLKNGAEANIADPINNYTPLHFAAQSGYLGIVKLLLSKEANINSVTAEGQTPLHFSAQCLDKNVFLLLLTNGAKIEAEDNNKIRPLHVATRSNNVDVLKVLIKKGVDINSRCFNNHSSLHLACLYGYTEIVSLLVKNYADINAANNFKNSPLHNAAVNGKQEIVEILLLNGAHTNAKNFKGLSPMHFAAANGHKDAISLLLHHSASINIQCKNGFYPLHYAIVTKHSNIIEFLLENKAQINAITNKGATPVHLAASLGYKDIVNTLVKYGAEIDTECYEDWTPLLLAVKFNHEEVVEILLTANVVGAKVDGETSKPAYKTKKKLNVSSQHKIKQGNKLLRLSQIDCNSLRSDFKGLANCPLIVASFFGHLNIVKLLLRFKADVNKCVHGMTALLAAAMGGHKTIVKALVESKCEIDPVSPRGRMTPLCHAALEGHADVAEFLLTNGADINWKCAKGTSLHLATYESHNDVVEILLMNRPHVNIRDHKENTALDLAIFSGNLDVVKILVRSNMFDLNAEYNDWTFVFIAAQEPDVEIVKFLAEAGCDIHRKNKKGSKPIHLAAREGFVDTVEYLVSKGCSVNERGFRNQTPLHCSVAHAQFEVVKYLVSSGADINAKDFVSGSTPLHFAAHYDVCLGITEYLLKNEAHYNIKDKMGNSPQEQSNNAGFIKLLSSTDKLFKHVKSLNILGVKDCIESGAVVNAVNSDNKTPLFYAVWKGAFEIVEILLKNKAIPNKADNNGFTPLHYASKFSHYNIALNLLHFGAVYNHTSLTGKTPSDFSNSNSFTDLFNLINVSFKDVESGSSQIIAKLNAIDDINLLRGIVGACNKRYQNLITLAVLSNHPCLEELKSVSQPNFSSWKEIALNFANKGDYNKAMKIFKRILMNKVEIFGAYNLSTLEIETFIAKMLYKQRFLDEALKLLKEIFEKQEKMLNSHHEISLKTKSFIALVLHRQGCNEQALSTYQETYSKQKEVLGETHDDTLDSYLHMGLVLDKLKRYEEALEINRKVFQMRENLFGELHPATLNAQMNIATVLSHKKQNAKALEIFQVVLEKNIKMYGLCNPKTLKISYNMAGIFSKLTKHREALKLLNNTLRLQESILGLNHPDTLDTQSEYAHLLFRLGKYNSALRGFWKCLPGIKSILGENSGKYRFSKDMVKRILEILSINGERVAEILREQQQDIFNAVKAGDCQAFYHLLIEGAAVDVTDIDGITPLIYAVNSGNVNFIKMLLRQGADISLTTNKGNTALHTAVSKCNEEIVEILLKNIEKDRLLGLLNAKTLQTGSSALHVASKNGCLDIVKLLLRYGANFKIENNENETPLSLSTNKSVCHILELLQELFDHAKVGDLKLISHLTNLENNEFQAVVNARDNSGRTLLALTLENKHTEISQILSELIKGKSD